MKRKEQDAFAPKKSFSAWWKENTSAKAFRVGGYSAISIVVVLVIAVIINLALGKLPSSITQFDMSTDKLSEISDQTKETVSALDQDVTIYWIVQDGSEDSTIEQLLNRYADLSSHLKVEQKDPVVNPTFAQQYTSETVYQNSLIVVSGESSQYIAYSDIYVTDYSNYYSTGETTTEFYGESCITSAISYVTSEDLPTMYYLGGHGSNNVDSALSNMIAKQNIQMVELNLLTEDAIPDDCSLLMIFVPDSDLSTEEASKVSDYLASGGKLLLLTQYTDTEYPNLMSVMESYGVTLKDGMVFEGDSTRYYQLPYMLLPKIGSHEITSPLSSGYYILYPQAQAIAQTGDASDTISITSLLSTTDSGYIKTDVQNMQSYDKESEDESGSFDLAVAIEDSDTNAQIVWFASALFSYSSYDEAVSGANTDLFLNSVSWMCQSESDITIHAKTISNEYLTVSSGTTALISLVGIGILPILCIAIGIFVWISRKKR